MRLLRPDLLVTPTDDPPGCSVKDERSGQVYEFGAVERFLLAQLRRPYRTEAVAKACNAKFDLEYTRGDIEEFVRLLDSWGMLDGKGVEALPEGENGEEMEDEITEPSSAAIEESELRRPNGWHLFNPERLLDGLNILAVPLRFLVWLVPVVFALGTMAVMFHWRTFVADVLQATDYFNLLGRILLWIFTINLVEEILRGLVARYFGLSTPSFGVTRMLQRPRFRVQVIPAGLPSRKVRLWLSGGPILLRIFLLGASALAWNMTRQSGSFMSTVAAELTVLSAIAIVLKSNPLWLGDGPRFLSAFRQINFCASSGLKSAAGLVLPGNMKAPAGAALAERHRALSGQAAQSTRSAR